jgi:DNA-binding NarL/FixJ family response regulator
MLDATLRSVGSRPVLVIDEGFDEDYGHLLLKRGALDYLDMRHLSSTKLLRRIEWAILRNGHRENSRTISANHRPAAEGPNSTAFQQLPGSVGARARQVLELLAVGMTPKQIASKLGTSPKTVWNQLAGLRLRFGVNSNHALGLLMLQLVRREIDAE